MAPGGPVFALVSFAGQASHENKTVLLFAVVLNAEKIFHNDPLKLPHRIHM
jgi:hypothetical protein